jgi:hypothetical protein
LMFGKLEQRSFSNPTSDWWLIKALTINHWEHRTTQRYSNNKKFMFGTENFF